MSQKSDQSTTRAANRKQVLNSLRQLGPLSRSQLVEVTGLSGAAITFVTTDLLEEKLLIEHEIGDTTAKGGRKPVLLDVNYKGHYSFGINLTENQIEVVLTDLQAVIQDHQSYQLEQKTPTYVLQAMTQIIQNLLERNNIKRQHINGLGLAMGGVLDNENGICLNSTILGWKNITIAQQLEQRSQIKVWLDNDINAFANAERLFGAGRLCNTFLAVTVGRGIGAALVLEGKVHQGRHSGIGSFGHTIVETNGRRCECGRDGCLEAYASEPSLLTRFNQQSPKQVNSITELLEQQDNPMVQALLTDAATRIGRSIAAVVNLLDPELVVLGGEGLRLGTTFIETITHSIKHYAYANLADQMPIELALETANSRTLWARGAASLAIQHAFDYGALPVVTV